MFDSRGNCRAARKACDTYSLITSGFKLGAPLVAVFQQSEG